MGDASIVATGLVTAWVLLLLVGSVVYHLARWLFMVTRAGIRRMRVCATTWSNR